jgi:multiple sugar transport system permease protein
VSERSLAREFSWTWAGKQAGRLTLHVLLIVGSLVMMVPFLWMLSSALKPEAQIFVFPPQWIPRPIVWQNLVRAWNAIPMGRFYLNSAIIAVAALAGQLLVATMAAYVFARLDFPAKDVIFMGFMATMMIPFEVTMIPTFIILRQLNWIDQYVGLIVPGLAHPFGIFMLRQFFLGIPTELEDAARIDGCSRFGMLFRIIIPLSKGAISTLGVFVFMQQWNAFLWPLIVLNTKEKFTLQIGLSMLRSQEQTDWSLLMAATLIVSMPIILLFLVAQKQFVRSITLTGLKM